MSIDSTVEAPVRRTRFAWIDAAKAIGIMWVVIAHNTYIEVNHPNICRLIYTFHVPLFFALSGATLLSSIRLRELLTRSMSLLWIFFTVTLLSLPLIVQRFQLDHRSVLDLLLGIVYGTGYTMHPVPMWFLPCLALTLPITLLVLKIVAPMLEGNNWRRNLVLFAVGLTLCLINSIWLTQQPYHLSERLSWGNLLESGAFWNLDLVGFGVGYALIGHALASWLCNSSMTNNRTTILAFVLTCVFVVLFMITQPDINLSGRTFAPILAALLVSTCGIVASFMWCRLILRPLPVLIKIGSATLPILAMHQLLQKKTLIFLGGAESSFAFVAFLASVFVGIAIPVICDIHVFRKSRLGQIIFYPRNILKISVSHQ